MPIHPSQRKRVRRSNNRRLTKPDEDRVLETIMMVKPDGITLKEFFEKHWRVIYKRIKLDNISFKQIKKCLEANGYFLDCRTIQQYLNAGKLAEKKRLGDAFVLDDFDIPEEPLKSSLYTPTEKQSPMNGATAHASHN